ncbi:MAG: terpene cyclase/mutase family protein [Phycisphaera sp. RhM]|nr:terpene cyclase/mutase family protein [Phycisphaera sp. RhM]
MTRKTALTDPIARWRDAPIAPIGGERSSDRCAAPLAESPAAEPPPTAAPPLASLRDKDAVGPAIDPNAPGDEGPRGIIARLATVRNSSWLASAALHLLFLIVLALLTYRLGGTERGLLIEGAWSGPDSTTPLESVTLADATADHQSEQQDLPVEVDLPLVSKHVADASIIAPRQASAVQDNALVGLQTGGATTAAERVVFLGGGGLSARTPEGRKKYGDRYGATRQSEMAVENALRWLAEHQRDDGSWSFDLRLSPCDGRCRNGKKANDDTPTPSTAATGLALLAFLGAGYTPEVGPYQEVVQRGLYYLRSTAAESEFGYDWQQGGSMYGQGIALMALSEALGMTKHEDRFDSDLYHYAERGTRFTVIAQHDSGSWGYTPGSPGDTTLTGWQILSLIGARKAGIETRSDTFTRAKEFLMSVREGPEFQFGYRTPKAEKTTTAIALTLLIYLGQTPGHTLFDEAIDELAEQGPTLTNVYHDYYATLALHHFRHRDWESWNNQLRDHLVRTQATEGHEAGSWHFRDQWGDVGGRVYTTAMCALTLEVYYRFLPLYDEPPDFPL